MFFATQHVTEKVKYQRRDEISRLLHVLAWQVYESKYLSRYRRVKLGHLADGTLLVFWGGAEMSVYGFSISPGRNNAHVNYLCCLSSAPDHWSHF